MQSVPIRWNPEIWAFIQVEAQHAGVSASEFARTGAAMYATIHAVQRGAPVAAALAELAEPARRVVALYPDAPG